MSEEFFLPPPAWARPVPDSILTLPHHVLIWRGERLWNAINSLVECIQGWADWLYRLDSKRRAMPFEAWELQKKAELTAAALSDVAAIGTDDVTDLLNRFPMGPGDGTGDWASSYDLESAKTKQCELNEWQTHLIRFQDLLQASPLQVLSNERPWSILDAEDDAPADGADLSETDTASEAHSQEGSTMTDGEFGEIVGCAACDWPREWAEWIEWAKAALASAELSAAGRMQPEKAATYLCRLLYVLAHFHSQSSGESEVEEDFLRCAFASGLVFSGLRPEADTEGPFLTALETCKRRGWVYRSKADSWQPGMPTGSGWKTFFQLKPAGRAVAESWEPPAAGTEQQAGASAGQKSKELTDVCSMGPADDSGATATRFEAGAQENVQAVIIPGGAGAEDRVQENSPSAVAPENAEASSELPYALENGYVFRWLNQHVELRPIPWKILRYLLERRADSEGRRTAHVRDLIDAVWGHDEEKSPSTVKSHLSALRTQLLQEEIPITVSQNREFVTLTIDRA